MSGSSAQFAWGRVTVIAAVVAGAVACANQGPPPGGPPDASPPMILSISPANMSTTPKVGAVKIKFDEVISEIPRGSRNLADLVFISPRSGQERVSWGRSEIAIKPSKGWKPNTVYSLQIKSGIVDLRGNAIDTVIKLVFSTGGPIPPTKVQGAVFDWGAGKPAGAAVVEAVAADSTRYQAVADEQGRYTLEHVPPGSYLLRAFVDKNANRDLDQLELWDSLRTVITQNTAAEFYTFQHDTIGLRIADVAVLDSNRVIKVTFDKPYSPNQLFTPASLIIKGADSTALKVVLVQTTLERAQAESLVIKQKADSVERVRRLKEDSTPGLRARNDSLARVRRADSVAQAERAKREAARTAAAAAARSGKRVPVRDTSPPPKMLRPQAYAELFVKLDAPLPPAKQFRLQVLNVRSLTEVARSPARTFTTAKPANDSSKRAPARPGARRDTTQRPPPSGAGATSPATTTPAAAPAGTPAAPAKRDTVKPPTPIKKDTLR